MISSLPPHLIGDSPFLRSTGTCPFMDEEGNFKKVNVYGEEFSGKALYDVLEHYARKGYYSDNLREKDRSRRPK